MMSFVLGENVGPYRVTDQLGQGGMATVFKAYHAALDRYVAIKVLHPAFKEDPHFTSRFQREARVVAMLEHPNIVPIYDFAEHNGHPYLVMKFIEGKTLKARLDQGPLTKTKAGEIVDSIGNALTYAHERGVLHRDIKPSNILISPDGSIYLADFGLARIAEAGASTLSQDMMLGTPQYISPEQAQGSRDLNEGTDIYSFGVVLYEIVVGKVPFNADTPFSIIHDHIYTPLPIPRTVNPHVPEEVELVLLKSLAKNREDRFDSVQHQVEAFDAAVRGEAVDFLPGMDKAQLVEQTETAVDLVREGSLSEADEGDSPPTKKKRWPWIIAGIVLASCCLFAFLAALAGSEESQPPPEGPPREELALEDSPLLEEVDNNPETFMRRGEALLENGRKALAIAEFSKAAELFLEEERYFEAVLAFEMAFEAMDYSIDRNTRMAERMAQALFLGAEDERMLDHLEVLYEIFPEWPVLPVVEARAQLLSGFPEEARQLSEEILESNPDDPLAHGVLAEYFLMTGSIDEAVEILDRAEEMKDQLPRWFYNHIQFLMSQL
jgi:serine/threonine protein kinase